MSNTLRAVPKKTEILHLSVGGFLTVACLFAHAHTQTHSSLTLYSHLLNHSSGPNRKALECSVFEGMFTVLMNDYPHKISSISKSLEKENGGLMPVSTRRYIFTSLILLPLFAHPPVQHFD